MSKLKLLTEEDIIKIVDDRLSQKANCKIDNSQCQKSNWHDCCCECIYHYVIFSHPCDDGKPTSNIYGYVCMTPLLNGKGEISKEHGLCEMFEKGGRMKDEFVKCIDCINCINLKLSRYGELKNECNSEKNNDTYSKTFGSLTKNKCLFYKQRQYKARLS